MTAFNDIFRVEVEPSSSGEQVLHLIGDLDLSTRPKLEKALAGVDALRPRTLILDLSRLEFVDSQGMHSLLMAANDERAWGGEVVLRNPSRRTLRVFQMIGLDAVLRIE